MNYKQRHIPRRTEPAAERRFGDDPMQDSGQSGGKRHHPRTWWIREMLVAKDPLGMLRSTWQPPTDVFESEQCVVVRMEIPGLDIDSLCIHLADDVLTVVGRREDGCPHRKVRFQQLEIHFGRFERSIPVAFPVRREGATWEFQDGFLVIILPRADQEAPVSTFYIKVNL